MSSLGSGSQRLDSGKADGVGEHNAVLVLIVKVKSLRDKMGVLGLRLPGGLVRRREGSRTDDKDPRPGSAQVTMAQAHTEDERDIGRCSW